MIGDAATEEKDGVDGKKGVCSFSRSRLRFGFFIGIALETFNPSFFPSRRISSSSSSSSSSSIGRKGSKNSSFNMNGC